MESLDTPTHITERAQSWCEISRSALNANVSVFRRRLAPGALLGMVVKSNAYGHGMVPCARALVDAGVDWLIVHGVDEAVALRAAGVEAPLYICGPVLPSRAEDVVRAKARLVVYDRELMLTLGAAARERGWEVPVHVKVETGNHRQGVTGEEIVALATLARDTEGVSLEGIATHYADIEDTTDHTFANSQLEAFRTANRALSEAGLEVPMAHSANSAATILWPETHGDLVRVGVSTYGLWPSRETYATALQAHAAGGAGFVPDLQPAMRWRARIAQLKEVPAGAYIGYGRTYRTTHPSRIAVLPVGYHEGYDRRLSNLAHVLVGGHRAPVRGRVCMNLVMVDVTHVPSVELHQPVTLLGRDGDETITADQFADWMGTIHYEALTRIHSDIPRVMVEDHR